MAKEALVAEGLTKSYGVIRALEGLNLKIISGESVGLLGPNGAGKTTTMKIFTNIIKPTSGSAYVNGYDAIKESTKALGNLGAMVEVPEFYPYLTPVEALSYFGRLRGISRSDLPSVIKKLLDRVKMLEWANVRIGKFSKGMKQRLAIAQTLLHDPPILMLDEPSLGLDPRGMTEVRNLVNELKKEKTIFMASHLLFEVSETCEKVALIDRGKLLAFDSVQKLERVFASQRIQVEVLKPLEASEIKAIESTEEVKKVTASGNIVFIDFKGDKETQAKILEALMQMNIRVASFRPALGSLEEVYMRVVKGGD
ncbi:MAG: ABC transporter ATP-binding protein [Promethearchaeati archaeon SRVP18_Atabeyarchaeia-1]